jgi:hypothetical protein
MASDPVSRHYEVLTPAERFALTIEAMARGDSNDADKLEDTCPRFNYHSEDVEYRDRMKRAYLIALLATINLKWRVEQVRSAELFVRLHRDFAWGPTLVATTAFLYGREYGRWECGAIDSIPLVDPEKLEAEKRERPDLREQLKEVKAISAEGVLKVAETLKYAIGEAHAVEILSQWEGFGRFCREVLRVEPQTLLAAYGLWREDPAAEVLAVYPEAKADEAKAAHWADNWRQNWERRFATR